MKSLRQVQYFAACVFALGLLALSLPDPSTACGLGGCVRQDGCYGEPGCADPVFTYQARCQNVCQANGCCSNGNYQCISPPPTYCGTQTSFLECPCATTCF